MALLILVMLVGIGNHKMPVLSDADIAKFDSQQAPQASKTLSDADIAAFDKQGKSNPAFLPNENKVQSEEFQRPDSVSSMEKNYSTGHPILGTLSALSIPFQRAESTVANTALEAQKGNTNIHDYLSAAGRGLSGDQQGELGDLIRTTGFGGPANEAIARVTGLLGAMPIWNGVGGAASKVVGGVAKTVNPAFQGVEGHAGVYRNILNPGKGVIDDVEGNGKDINDAFQTMADERLPIKTVAQNNRDTIDVNDARTQLKGTIKGLSEQLSDYLKDSPAKFDLNDIKDQVDSKLRGAFKDDEDYEKAVDDVKDQMDASIRQRGKVNAQGNISPIVDAKTLNEIKQGKWQKGYNLLAPTAQKTSRIIGGVMKQAIVDAHPDDTTIQDLNSKMGKLQTADAILQKSHGKVVNGGALGNYIRGGVGAIVGEGIGAAMGHPIAGPIVGNAVALHLNRFINNPEFITSTLAKIRDLHDFGGSAEDAVKELSGKFGDQISANMPNLQQAMAARLKGSQGQPEDLNITKNLNDSDVGKIGDLSAEPGVTKVPADTTADFGGPEMAQEAEGGPAKQYIGPGPSGDLHSLQSARQEYETQRQPIKDDLNYGSKIAASAAVGAGAMAVTDKAQASQVNDHDVLKAVLGEQESGLTGQRAVASTIRNRRTIHGAYGANAIIEKGGNFYRKGTNGKPDRLIPKYAVLTAKQAVQDSKNKDFSNGSTNWFSDADLKQPAVMRMVKKMTRIGRYGDNNFYRKT